MPEPLDNLKPVASANGRRATMTQVAEAAGVTKGTVSKVLRGGDGFSDETRRRVMAAVQNFQYRRSTEQQRRGRVHIGQIGFMAVGPGPASTLIAGNVGAGYLLSMFEGCTAEAVERGESISLCRMTWDELAQGKIPAAVARNNVDGIVVRGAIDDKVASWLASLRVPVVLADCDRHLTQFSHVRIEHVRTMSKVVDHLTARGGQQFAVIAGDMDHLNAQERLAGLQVALTRRGLSFGPDAIVSSSDWGPDDGRRGVRTLIERGVKFDALVCQNDGIAMGALAELKQRGVAVPDEVRVVGYDDFPFAATLDPPLTSVGNFTFRLGQAAAGLLYDEIRLGKSERKQVVIEGEVISRKST
ncbi:LacI family DNA-binding transcriptional regulator [Phycisphaerales bacterium AB-hyl4]|uniref:LacI family DNA-binding transcriptional regulator n=1 Tax=Natronomicrosphaera hydrolytica TaxID=3242702 RepID=A0ABV4U8P4_9BACT